MATLQDATDKLCDAIVEIAESRVAEFREGDKFMRFVNVHDAARAMVHIEQAERLADRNANTSVAPSCYVGALL